jgi:hypothetical protein
MKAQVKSVGRAVRRRPAESTAVGIYPALTGLLVAFGVDPVRAAAIAGVAAAVAPMAVTWWRTRK